MSDYLNNLLARELGRVESVEPRRPSRFEPPAARAAFPTAAGLFGDARGGDLPEPGDVSRTWMTDASAGETETFADAPPQTFPPSPPPGLAPEARPPAQPLSSFEPRPSEDFSPSEQTRARRSVSDAEAADAPSPTPKLEPSQTPAPPTAKRTPALADGGQSRTFANVSPLADDAASSRVVRAEPSNNPPSRPSPSGPETDEAGSIPPRRAAPPRETLLVPVLDAREFDGRAALARAREAERAADARASQLAETPTPRHPKHSARADESAAKSEADESSRTTERRERRENSEAEAREGQRVRRQTESRVEPRVTRRAESRAAEHRRRQQADAQAEGASAPTVNVTIGRIEIRASAPAPRRAPRRESSGGAPMSLEDYLRRRGGGGGGR